MNDIRKMMNLVSEGKGNSPKEDAKNIYDEVYPQIHEMLKAIVDDNSPTVVPYSHFLNVSDQLTKMISSTIKKEWK